METKELQFEQIKEQIKEIAKINPDGDDGQIFNLLFGFLYEDIIKISKKTLASAYGCRMEPEELAHEVLLNVFRKIVLNLCNDAQYSYVKTLGYIKKTTINVVNGWFNKDAKTPVEDFDFDLLESEEESVEDLSLNNLMIRKKRNEVKLQVYKQAMEAVLLSRLSPYAIIGFSYNKLILPFIIVAIREHLKTSKKFDIYFLNATNLHVSVEELEKRREKYRNDFSETVETLLSGVVKLHGDEKEAAKEAEKLIFTNYIDKATCPTFTALVISNMKVFDGYEDMKKFVKQLHKLENDSFDKLKETITKKDIKDMLFKDFYGTKKDIDVICEWTRKGSNILLEAQENIVRELIEKGCEDFE